MSTNRTEAFSDGVIAIIITIMVLGLNIPRTPAYTEPTLSLLKPFVPTLLSYALSFVFVGIYWNNHHHLLQAAKHVSGGVMWANLHWLFWLSLVPFVTGWMGQNHFASIPVAAYGVVLLLNAIAFTILTYTLACAEGKDSALRTVLGDDRKGKISLALYTSAVVVAFFVPLAACAIYGIVAVMWLIPDKRFEKASLAQESAKD